MFFLHFFSMISLVLLCIPQYDQKHEGKKARGYFELPEIRLIARKLLKAVHYLHKACEITHADIKSANVLFVSSYTVIYNEVSNTKAINIICRPEIYCKSHNGVKDLDEVLFIYRIFMCQLHLDIAFQCQINSIEYVVPK